MKKLLIVLMLITLVIADELNASEKIDENSVARRRKHGFGGNHLCKCISSEILELNFINQTNI